MLKTFNDICIVPSIISKIEHRSECNPYKEPNSLPLFTAPMSSVINENNWKIFKQNQINTIIPRNIEWDIRLNLCDQTFIAVSLYELEVLIESYKPTDTFYICVDIANGHMEKLLISCKKAKEKFGDKIVLMTGNIANPETYLEYAKIGIDYIRCGIGGGSCCTTASNVSINYGMVSLIQECYNHKKHVIDCFNKLEQNPFKSIPKIIADGGFNNFDQIIKALAIGADYVMLGKIFAMSEEACGEVVFKDAIKCRKYYGMSTKKAQNEFGNKNLKTAEGIETIVPVKYTLQKWHDNFISYLRSAMSYCDSRTLEEFKMKAIIKDISNNSFNAYYK